MRQWVDAIPLRVWLLFAALAGGIVGFGSYTFAYAQGLSYFSDDPSACANCHVMREVFEGWNKGSHKAVASCNDCHTPHSSLVEKYVVKGLNGWNHSKAFTFDDWPEPIQITPFNKTIAQENCLSCHANLVSYISHPHSSHPTDCLTCHRGVGHGR
jgi:cytochrome c nitrite reductase small subunit